MRSQWVLSWVVAVMSSLSVAGVGLVHAEDPKSDWKTMFDGKTMNGWKVNENPESWKVEDGCLVCQGSEAICFMWVKISPSRIFISKRK